MVRVGPLATGVVFLALFVGLELRIPAITNLLPGSYAGLAYTGYIGLGFLLAGISSLAAAFSGPHYPRMSPGSTGAGSPGVPDMATMAAAMAAFQAAQMSRGTAGPANNVVCTACGRSNSADARFCQGCAAPLAQQSPAPGGAGAPPSGLR
jgi:hypothetical protein